MYIAVISDLPILAAVFSFRVVSWQIGSEQDYSRLRCDQIFIHKCGYIISEMLKRSSTKELVNKQKVTHRPSINPLACNKDFILDKSAKGKEGKNPKEKMFCGSDGRNNRYAW